MSAEKDQCCWCGKQCARWAGSAAQPYCYDCAQKDERHRHERARECCEEPVCWIPRYVAYSRAHGRTPAEQFDFDASTTAPMVKFSLWIRAKIREACEHHNRVGEYPGNRYAIGNLSDCPGRDGHKVFDEFIGVVDGDERVPITEPHILERVKP